MALNFYAGNQLEQLAEVFCNEIYNQNNGNIFEPERVVVQTKGMELFLRKYLAKNAEIAANIETPFLNRFVSDVMHAILPPDQFKKFRYSTEQYSPDVLKWRIFDELKKNPEKYPDAKNYTADTSLCYQLSVQLAGTFDRYIWYHADMLREWQKKNNRETHWEKTLYLALLDTIGSSPDSFFVQCIEQGTPVAAGSLAKRYSLFGIGSMPPILLDLCRKIGEVTDIHLFYLNPCATYWGDMLHPKEAIKAGLEKPLENPLFINLGTWGREFFENTIPLMSGLEKNCFVSPAEQGSSLLHRLQEDIFNNETPEKETDEYKNDRSISIHNCHNKRREIEVLHDQLLLAIKELKVRPDDIIVMAPDINAYAPIIEAIFSSGKLANCYNISDRSLLSISGTAETLERILRLYSTRCTAEEIFTIVDSLPVKANFEKLGAIESFTIVKNEE